MMGNSTHQRTYVIEVHTVSWVFFTIQYLYENQWKFPYLYTFNTYMYLVYTVTYDYQLFIVHVMQNSAITQLGYNISSEDP